MVRLFDMNDKMKDIKAGSRSWFFEIRVLPVCGSFFLFFLLLKRMRTPPPRKFRNSLVTKQQFLDECRRLGKCPINVAIERKKEKERLAKEQLKKDLAKVNKVMVEVAIEKILASSIGEKYGYTKEKLSQLPVFFEDLSEEEIVNKEVIPLWVIYAFAVMDPLERTELFKDDIMEYYDSFLFKAAYSYMERRLDNDLRGKQKNILTTEEVLYLSDEQEKSDQEAFDFCEQFFIF